MARTYPFAQSFQRLFQSRYGSTVYGRIQEIFDTVIPVQVMGKDFSDVERPAWGISSYAEHPGIGNRYVTSSLTSAVDVAVEGFGWELVYTSSGQAAFVDPVVMLTPDTSWIPFAENPITYYPGIRPRIEFDPGRTIAITGRNVAPPPFWGLRVHQNGVVDGTLALWAPMHTWHAFDPPLILPATMFLTVSAVTVDRHLTVNWRYREIG